jgi:hypothetical protein
MMERNIMGEIGERKERWKEREWQNKREGDNKLRASEVDNETGKVGMFDNSLFDNSNGLSSTLFWTTFY